MRLCACGWIIRGVREERKREVRKGSGQRRRERAVTVGVWGGRAWWHAPVPMWPQARAMDWDRMAGLSADATGDTADEDGQAVMRARSTLPRLSPASS
jgi:hypothetical protein